MQWLHGSPDNASSRHTTGTLYRRLLSRGPAWRAAERKGPERHDGYCPSHGPVAGRYAAVPRHVRGQGARGQTHKLITNVITWQRRRRKSNFATSDGVNRRRRAEEELTTTPNSRDGLLCSAAARRRRNECSPLQLKLLRRARGLLRRVQSAHGGV